MPASRTTNATDPGPLQLYVERVDAVSEWNPLRTSESRPITRSGGLPHLVSARCCSRSSPRSHDRPSQEKKQEHDASSHGSRGELGCPCSDRYDNEANP